MLDNKQCKKLCMHKLAKTMSVSLHKNQAVDQTLCEKTNNCTHTNFHGVLIFAILVMDRKPQKVVPKKCILTF